MAVEKKNIFLSNTLESFDYIGRPQRAENKIPIRIRQSHGEFLKTKFEQARQKSHNQQDTIAYQSRDGVYIEFAGKPGFDLSTKSLEDRPNGIRLQNVRIDPSTIPLMQPYTFQKEKNMSF